MKRTPSLLLLLCALTATAQQTISPARPVPTGKAPHMTFKRIKHQPEEDVYAIVFLNGDEVLSGLTDFATEHRIGNAHFTGIGAVSGATLAWLNLPEKIYNAIPVNEQVEVLALTGDIATFNNKPVVHMHAVLGKHDGTTVGGHVFELDANPTVEVFLTANSSKLTKRPDDASGMKLIDPEPKP